MKTSNFIQKIGGTYIEIFKKNLTFGDDCADIGMLKLCGIGVSINNAIGEIMKIADAVTLLNEEDGVAVYLEKQII